MLSTPSSTQEGHNWPNGWMDDILAGVVDILNESSVGVVGDTFYHLNHLTLIVVESRPLNIPICSNEGCLLWGASHVAEVLAKVVVAGGAGGGKEGADLRKA